MNDELSAKVNLDPGTAVTRKRYDRIAPVYDLVEWGMELRFANWRRELWSRLAGGRILEVGVGTGKNLRFHPTAAEVTAIDLSPGMLWRAHRRTEKLGSQARLEIADVQRLPYEDQTFDAAVATFVFCSVPDPVRGLREVRRVLKPGGRLLMVEHVLSEFPGLRRVMRWLDPVPFHIWGAHIDRETVNSVKAAGFKVNEATNLSLDTVKRIEAVNPD